MRIAAKQLTKPDSPICYSGPSWTITYRNHWHDPRYLNDCYALQIKGRDELCFNWVEQALSHALTYMKDGTVPKRLVVGPRQVTVDKRRLRDLKFYEELLGEKKPSRTKVLS